MGQFQGQRGAGVVEGELLLLAGACLGVDQGHGAEDLAPVPGQRDDPFRHPHRPRPAGGILQKLFVRGRLGFGVRVGAARGPPRPADCRSGPRWRPGSR